MAVTSLPIYERATSLPRAAVRLAAMLLLAAGASWFAGWVPRGDADFLRGVVWAALLGCSILFWPVPDADKTALLRLWVVRSFVCLGLMTWYEYHYQSALDAYAYFRQTLGPVPPYAFGKGEELVVRVGSLTSGIFPDSYHAAKMTFAMIGFLALYLLYRAAVRIEGRGDVRALYLLSIFPSVAFWSSILGKDPLQLLGIAIYVYGVIDWMLAHRLRSVIWIVVGIVASMAVRLWTGPILLIPLLALLIDKRYTNAYRIVVVALVAAGVAAGASRIATRFGITNTSDALVTAGALSHGWEGGSAIDEVSFAGDPWAAVRHVPGGMLTALFRPLPGEILNPFGILAGLENLFLVYLTITTLKPVGRAVRQEPLVAWAVAIVLTWAVVYGFAAYNLGAIVRFKLQILPIMLFVFAHVRRERGTQRVALT